jgi:hypothetical protein
MKRTCNKCEAENKEECDCDLSVEESKEMVDNLRLNKYPERPKTMVSRDEIYKMINGERDYQDKSNFAYDDSSWSISDWVVFIRRYLEKIDDWTGHPKEQMDEMRKVAALAVACMEFNGARPRNGRFGK